MKHPCLLIFLLSSFFTSHSQISGRVSDTVGNPLQNVNVYDEGTFNGTTTNANGEFKLKLEQTKESYLIFKFWGFRPKKKDRNLYGYHHYTIDRKDNKLKRYCHYQ